ncbi:High-affnity carbon uptake protein Hat/HatR [Thermogutta terrifontis]|uniref:High-affnity carbon uptake protein Hat/HatR n=1 Tax=Thermogutta terrifontis TaxID=1331910 RepID=A0A286RFI6_9BACT|nr:High-affnity carbon uptake protein Hat/HatR [Thermogutta terrifontis]
MRFSLPGLPTDEVYVARKLTIGRTPDNVFVIPEDAVDRHHAIVDFSEEQGQFVVRCLQRDGYLETGGQQVQELVLQPGVRFRIGSGEFECLASPEVTSSREERNWSVCPHCRSERCGELALGTGSCPSCQQEVMVVQDGLGRRVILPCRVGPCRLVRLVGQGGMTWVFEGQVDGQSEPVAIKILMPHLLNDDAALQRFKRESEILRQVRHPRVLRRLGQGRWKGLPCVLTPLMAQGSLRAVLDELRRQKQVCHFEVALRWFLDVMAGLEVLHQLGLVHRDLKPSNILLDGASRAVVGDLGIVRRLGQETASLTATGAALGTYHYMAPEQWENPESVDQRADLYALGVTFYELLTGRLPTGRWQAPSQMNRTVPAAFDRILERLLEPWPERRFDSVASLRQALLENGLIRPADAAEETPGPQADDRPASPHSPPTPPLVPKFVFTAADRQEESASSSAQATRPGGTTSLPDLPVKHSAMPSLSPSGTHWIPVPNEAIAQESRRSGLYAVIAVGLGVLVLVGVVLVVTKRPPSGRIPSRDMPYTPDTPPEVGPTTPFGVKGDVALTSDRPPAVGPTSPSFPRVVVTTSSGYVTSVAFSPNGRQVLTGSWDGTARVWDAATGKELRQFEGHTGWVLSVAFSPDGRQVLTGSGNPFERTSDNTARLWDAATGQELRRFEGHTDPVTSVAFSPDGRQVLTGSGDNTARLWDAATGKELRRFEGHTEAVLSVAVSPDGRQVLTGSADKTARLWDAATGKELRRFEGHILPVLSVAFSPDGRQVLTGSADKTARLWDAATGKELRRFEGHTDWVTSVAFSPDGRQVLTGSRDNTARLWDAATGEELRRFEGHILPVLSVAFSPDGRQVLTGSGDNTARLWDAATGKELRRFEGHTDPVTSVAFSPDGRQVLTGSRDNTARLWDAATGKELRRFEGHTDAVWPVAFSPDGRQVLTGAGHFVGVAPDNTARLWDVTTGHELRRFEGHTDMVSSVAFRPDGRQILTGSQDGTARLWDVATGRELCRFYGFTDGHWLVLTPEGYFDTDIIDPIELPVTYYDPVTGQDLPMEEVIRRYHRPDLVRVKLGG